MPTRSLTLAMAVVAGLAAPGAAYAQSSANPPASGASTGLPNLPTMTVGTAPTKQYTGPGWTVQVPADWGNDPSDATTVGGITAGKCLMGLSVGHKAATGTLEAVVAGEVKTAPGPATPAPATVDNQPGAILDVPFSDGTASGSEYVWLENGEQWTATFVQVLCDKSVANDWAAELNLFKTQIWPTFAVNAGASPNAAAASGAAANTSIDSSTLVTYTGTGYSISLPPGWTPASSSPGTVGGKLPDGSIGVLVVQNTDAGAQGLDVLAPAAVQGMSTSVGAVLGTGTATVDGQSASTADFSIPAASDGSLPAGYGRSFAWIENGKFWFVAYIGFTGNQASAGLDMFKNQIMSTLTLTGN